MPDQPSITLAIPCYNAAVFIEAVLGSITRQTRPPEEIIVVDDGSTDDSPNIVKQFAQVQLIRHGHNRGIAAARNTAWQNAHGDIVVFIDADTLADPRLLERLARCYRDKNIAGAGGRGLEIIQETRFDRWRKEVLYQGWGGKFRSRVHFLFGLCSSYRKWVLEKFDGFDPLFRVSGEDMDFCFRVNKGGLRLVYEPRAVVLHLRADDQVSLRQMTYRHCYWGFLAQRKNHTLANKMSLAKSIRLFLRQVLLLGIVRREISYACLTIKLHQTIMRAWIDSRQKNTLKQAVGISRDERFCWEGHQVSHIPSQSTITR